VSQSGCAGDTSSEIAGMRHLLVEPIRQVGLILVDLEASRGIPG